MAGINFVGSFSGIDGSMIDQLMEAERMPLVQLSNKKTGITEKQNAWRDINTRLNSLFDKVKTLQSSDTFTSKKSTSTNDQIITMSARTSAAAGTYRVNVEQLATNTSIIGGIISSAGFDDEGKFINESGSITIMNADSLGMTEDDKEAYIESATINIDKGDSLKDIVNKINDKNKTTGINATIINNRLVLTDEKSGSRNIELIGDGGGTLNTLGLSKGDRAGQKGQEAIFNINGVEVNRNSNTVSDVIEGVTINLHKEHSLGEYDTVTIGQDTEKTTEAIQDFVDQYNSTIRFIEDKMAAGDPDVPGSKGTLAGDSSLMRLHSSLRNLVTSSLANENTDIRDASQIGITTIDRFGQLKFDASKLTEALSEDPQRVIDFFSSKKDGEDIGFVPRLNGYIDSFISKHNGIIKGKTESYDRTLKDLNRQIDNFNDRMERKEQYYIKMFSALDVAMMQAESQMSWLEGQINSMNNVRK